MNRRRSLLRVSPAFMAIALPFLAACGEDRVQILQRPEPVVPETEGNADIGVVVQASSAANVARVQVTVTSSDLSLQISQDLEKTDGQWRGKIPHIPFGHCVFHVQAFDATDKLLYQQNVSGVVVGSGVEPIVLVVFQPDELVDPLVNHPPRIQSLVAWPRQVEPGGDFQVAVAADDIDGDPLMYRLMQGVSVLVDSASPDLIWQAPKMQGDFEVGVAIRDAQDTTAGMTFTLQVGSSDVNPSPPKFNTWPILYQVVSDSASVGTGKTTKLTAIAIDAEAEALTFAWSDDCGGSFDDKQAMNPVWTAPVVTKDSSCQLALTVTDPHGATAKAMHKVNVHVPNFPPIVDETYQSHLSINIGGKVHFRIRAHDPDNDNIVFGWALSDGNPELATSSASQSDFEWTAPATPGTCEAKAFVDDGKNSPTTHSFFVDVKDVVPPPAPMTLATGLVQPGDIASDGMDVFWLTGGSADPMNPGGTVMRCSIEGCNGLPTVLAHGQLGPHRMTLDATTVYWTMTGTNGMGTDGGLRWCEKQGCFDMPAYLEGGFLNRAIAVYASSVYWSIEQQGITTIRTSSLIGPWAPKDVATFTGYSTEMAANDWGLVWTESAPLNAIGQLSPPGQSMVSVLVGGQMNAPVAMAADHANVYWIGGDSIFACELSGCGGTPTTLVTGLDTPTAIVSDGVNLYFTLAPMGPGAVMKCPITGGTPVIMASGANVMSPGAIAVDATSVYWTDVSAGTVVRMAK